MSFYYTKSWCCHCHDRLKTRPVRHFRLEVTVKKSADADSGSDFKTPSGSNNDAASDSDSIPDTRAEKKHKNKNKLNYNNLWYL